MMKKKAIHKHLIILAILSSIFATIGLFMVWETVQYTNRVPKITPKTAVNASIGETLELHEIFDVECKGDYHLELQVMDFDSDAMDFQVSKDAQALFVGTTEGTITVSVNGYGEVAELVSETNTITITAQ